MRRLTLALMLSMAVVPAAPSSAQTSGSCPERGTVRAPLVMNYTCDGLYALAAAVGDAATDRTVSGFACTQRADSDGRAWSCTRGSGGDEQRALWVHGAAAASSPSSGSASGECATNPSSVFCGPQAGSGPGTQDESRPGTSSGGSSGGTRSCAGSGRIQGLAAVRTTCAVARATARAVGAASGSPRRANGFTCKISNRTSAGRGWTCTRTRSGRRQAVSWVYVLS